MEFKFIKTKTKKSFKQKFGYDVTDVAEYINMESPEITSELIASSVFLSLVTTETEVKNKKLVKILKGSIALREMVGCVMPEGGSLDFSAVTIETKLIGFAQKFCNQDLLSGWTQLLMRSGANQMLNELPIEQQASALFLALLKKGIEDLVFLGDTASPDPNLDMFDGLVKLWTADVNIPSAGIALPMTVGNAFDNFKLMARKFTDEVLESGLDIRILASATDYNLLIDNLVALNNYHFTAEESEKGLKIPGTDVYVMKRRQLATGEVFGVVLPYILFGTDSESDLSEIKIKEMQDTEEMRASAYAFAGITYAFPEYFVKP